MCASPACSPRRACAPRACSRRISRRIPAVATRRRDLPCRARAGNAHFTSGDRRAGVLAARAGELPPYDAALLRRDSIFSRGDGAPLVHRLDGAQRADLSACSRGSSTTPRATARVRPARLPLTVQVRMRRPIWCARFQDAVFGPVLPSVSLLRDAYRVGGGARWLDWAVRYWERARARRGAGSRGLRTVLAGLRMRMGVTAAIEGPRHLRAPEAPRDAEDPYLATCRA